MPLSKETLGEIAERIKALKEKIADVDEIISDLKKSAIDISGRDEEVRQLKENLRKWESFYNLQVRRAESGERQPS